MTRTRGPDCPRITGVPTPGPNDWLVMPGSFFSVSPMVVPDFRAQLRRPTTPLPGGLILRWLV